MIFTILVTLFTITRVAIIIRLACFTFPFALSAMRASHAFASTFTLSPKESILACITRTCGEFTSRGLPFKSCTIFWAFLATSAIFVTETSRASEAIASLIVTDMFARGRFPAILLALPFAVSLCAPESLLTSPAGAVEKAAVAIAFTN